MTLFIITLSMLVVLLLLLGAFGIFTFFTVDIFLHPLPFVASPKGQVEKIFKMISLQKGDVFYDLGSGDGRLVIEAARRDAKAFGFEINPFLVFWSRFLIKRAGLQEKGIIYQKSLWEADFSQADIIYIYARVPFLAKLEKKIFSQAKRGALIITNNYQFPNRQYHKAGEKIFIYKKD